MDANEEKVRETAERLGNPWSPEDACRVVMCRKQCEHPDCLLARALLAMLDRTGHMSCGCHRKIVAAAAKALGVEEK